MDRRREIAREIARQYTVLSPEALEAFASILVPFKFNAKTTVLKEGEVCNYMYFVVKGLIRQYYYKGRKQVTEHISSEGGMVICIESTFQHEPTRLIVETLEPSVLYGIPFDKLHQIASTSYELCKLLFAFLERSLIISQQKADTIRFENAKERYARTLRDNPEIIRRAPLHHVASFLQMTPETLSRVRSMSFDED